MAALTISGKILATLSPVVPVLMASRQYGQRLTTNHAFQNVSDDAIQRADAGTRQYGKLITPRGNNLAVADDAIASVIAGARQYGKLITPQGNSSSLTSGNTERVIRTSPMFWA